MPKPVHRPAGLNKRKLDITQEQNMSTNNTGHIPKGLHQLPRTPRAKVDDNPSKKTKRSPLGTQVQEKGVEASKEALPPAPETAGQGPRSTQHEPEDVHMTSALENASVAQKAAKAGLHRASALLAARRAKGRAQGPNTPKPNQTLPPNFSSPDVGSDMTLNASCEVGDKVLQTAFKKPRPVFNNPKLSQMKLDFTPALDSPYYNERQKALFESSKELVKGHKQAAKGGEEPPKAKQADVTRDGESTIDISPIRAQAGVEESLGQELQRALELAQSVKKSDRPRAHSVSQLKQAREEQEQMMNLSDNPEDALVTKHESARDIQNSIRNLEEHLKEKEDYISPEDRVVLIEVKNELTRRLQMHCIVRGHLFKAEGRLNSGQVLLEVGHRLQQRLDNAMTVLAAIPNRSMQLEASQTTLRHSRGILIDKRAQEHSASYKINNAHASGPVKVGASSHRVWQPDPGDEYQQEGNCSQARQPRAADEGQLKGPKQSKNGFQNHKSVEARPTPVR